MNTATRLIQAAAATAFATLALAAQAAPQPVHQLPRVVITGKSTPAAQQIVQLPRVVVEGRSLNSLQADTRLASAAANKPQIQPRKS
ncbi:MAG TPA: hypothetical protein VJN44_14705 [Roseateles sp.]|nr:hypothetical protein [Roseateles sp.]